MTTSNSTAVALGAMRSAVGIGTWVAPRTTTTLFGLGSAGEDERAALVVRLFGVRDAVLGQATLWTSDDDRRLVLALGAVCDGIDVIASLIALRRGVRPLGIALVGGGAALFLSLGILARRME